MNNRLNTNKLPLKLFQNYLRYLKLYKKKYNSNSNLHLTH